jgi:hypothetical protein
MVVVVVSTIDVVGCKLQQLQQQEEEEEEEEEEEGSRWPDLWKMMLLLD